VAGVAAWGGGVIGSCAGTRKGGARSRRQNALASAELEGRNTRRPCVVRREQAQRMKA
jgi:hypothetical protein